MKSVVVIGAGIKGAAVAAAASLCGFVVTLVDRDAVGAGTSSTNHGRLHLGTAGWWKEPVELLRRRRRSSELVRRLPSVVANGDEAIYCFEDAGDFERFCAVSATVSIPVTAVRPDDIEHEWVARGRYATLALVPEFAFEPSALAGRFALTSVANGGTVLTGVAAVSCERRADGMIVALEGGEELSADIVVNTMTRWSGLLRVPENAPRLDIEWWRWNFLCLRAAALPDAARLNRVIVVMDRDRSVPSVIPHGPWLTLDYKDTVLTRASSPENLTSDWRRCDTASEGDRTYVATLSSAFPPLRDLERLSAEGELYVLTGVHARTVHATPGSTGMVIVHEREPGYILTFGGQASTAFLDALEVVSAICASARVPIPDESELVELMASALAPRPIEGYRPMRWNCQD